MSYKLVVLGTSLGGLRALQTVLGGLQADYPLAVAVVQHQMEGGGSDLVGILQQSSALPVAEADDKQEIRGGAVYLAPAGYHLLVEPDRFALTTEGPVHYARPSIDVLFESAAESYGAAVVGVAMTSSSADGARGLAAIKARGGLALVQDPAMAESPVLPVAALAAVPAAVRVPLRKIAPFLTLLALPGGQPAPSRRPERGAGALGRSVVGGR